MNSKHLRPMVALGAAAVLLVALGGCSSSTKAPDEPVAPDLSTPQRAIRVLEEAYSDRNLDAALYLHHTDFRYFPDPAAQIPFLEPGETSWDLDRETAILERLLVPDRISWLDQVLLEIDIDSVADSAGSPDIQVVRAAAVDLLLLRGETELLEGRSDLELVYLQDANGDYFLLQVREASPAAAAFYEVSELKSLVEDAPTVETQPATDITTGTAQLNGTSNAQGLETTVWFEWGTDSSYGNVTPELVGGMNFVPVPFNVVLNGLAVDTEYHYRIVARSEWGTSRGEDVTFTTSP